MNDHKMPIHKRRILSESEKMNLPVPRLEIRKYRYPEPIGVYDVRADYSLIYEGLMGEHILIPLGQTKIQTSRWTDPMELPFRNGADLLNEMWILKLRGFVIFEDQAKEIFITPENCPNALAKKMKED